MKGHIRKRGEASWAIILDIGMDATGKRRQKWHSVKGTKRDAERELNRLLHDINRGSYVEPSNESFSKYLDRWLRDYAELRTSPKTLERYTGIINGHIKPKLGHHPLAKLLPIHIQNFYTTSLSSGRMNGKGGLSPQTVLHFHRVIHRALGQAVRWQLLARNPADAVEAPKPERKEMAALNTDETAGLLKSLEGHNLNLPVFLAVTTGMRRGEVLALRWANVDLDREQLHVTHSLEQTKQGLRFKAPKTKKSRRSISLPKVTVKFLKNHLKRQKEKRLALGPVYQDNDLVCAKEDGSLMPPDTLSTQFASFMKNSEIKRVRFHDLRHTHATQLLKQGVHPKIVSERLGHSNISITLDLYSHVLPGMQEEAISGFDAALSAAMENGGR